MQIMILYILFTLSCKSCSGGMFKRLQQVMQIEKERETDSVKNASAETGIKGKSENQHSIIDILPFVSKQFLDLQNSFASR